MGKTLNLVSAMESYTKGASVEPLKASIGEMKDILTSVKQQYDSGTDFKDMKELEGYDEPDAMVTQWSKVYNEADEIIRASEDKALEDKDKELQKKEAGLAISSFTSGDKKPVTAHKPVYDSYRQHWTMKDVVMALQDDPGYSRYMKAVEAGYVGVQLQAEIPAEIILQAVNYEYPLDPSVRVSDERRRPRPFLDLVNITTNPRSHLVYAPITTTVSEQGLAANRPSGRERGANAAEARFDLGRVSLEKKSIGAWTGIDKEFGVASPAGLDAAVQSLSYAMLEAISTAAMNGDGTTGEQWAGLLGRITGAANTTAVPGSGAGTMYSYIEAAIGTLADRGYFPNASLVRRADRNKVRETLKGENFNAGELVNGQPQPEGVPMIITPDVGNNTAVTGLFDPSTIGIELQSNMLVTTSEDRLMERNQVAVAMFVSGNVALYEPRAFFKTTATNNTDEG